MFVLKTTAEARRAIKMSQQRKFGIEIECFGMSMQDAKDLLVEAGIPCCFESRACAMPLTWKIVPDASVPNGFEVVSPILCGDEGMEQVRKVANLLEGAGAKVDKRCGFHVHVNANDLNGPTLVNIVRRYAKFEDQIDAWMPVSRRANNNERYCMPANGLLSVVERHCVQSAMFIAGKAPTRNYKVNIQAYIRHGTVEFRQHSGTIDSKKMLNWIKFCLQFVENSKLEVQQEPMESTGFRKNAVVKKYKKLAEALDFYRTYDIAASSWSLSEKTGIPEEQIPGYISTMRKKYNVRIDNINGLGYHYKPFFGANLLPPALTSIIEAVEGTIPDLPRITVVDSPEPGLFHGLSGDTIAYFKARTVSLATTTINTVP